VIGPGAHGRREWCSRGQKEHPPPLPAERHIDTRTSSRIYRYQSGCTRHDSAMDKNTPVSQTDRRASSLRPPPAITLEDIVGVGACEACRGRITKVYTRSSYFGLSGVGMLTHGSAQPNIRNVKSAAGDERPAIIAVPPRRRIGPSRNTNMERCAFNLIIASSTYMLIFSHSPLTSLTRYCDEFD
jgi:hypothetical protein